jgi:MATE family multidrug resistance protein
MTADQLINTLPLGQGVAASVRIGNLLGAKRPKDAARSANVAAVLSMIVGGIVLAILLGTRNVFALMFTDDKDVVKLVAITLPWVALFQIAGMLPSSKISNLTCTNT